MKKLTLFISLAVFTACTDKHVPEAASVNIPAGFSAKTTSFAMDFWKTYEQENGGSYFLSPLSLNIALGMLVNGTEGETREEIRQVLGFSNADLADMNISYAELIDKLPRVDPAVTNTTASSVWYEKDFTVENAYLETLKKSFNAGVYAENFSDPATVDKINRWAAAQTNDKIRQVLEKIEPHQVLFLLNALYFKGDWTEKFDEKNTVKAPFYGATREVSQDFMSVQKDFAYTENGSFRMVELPYGNEKYAFIAMLPVKGTADEMIRNLTREQWDAARAGLVKQKVAVTLPRFKMELSKNLTGVLQAMGMKRAFTDRAELGGISKSGRLFVDFVKQDTYLSVDEKGSEAAAVTSIGVGVTSAPMYTVFRCDRPFAFAIVEKTSDTIQFIGKVNDVE
ncbi:serpin family protein [Leadbetterella sp. DM7]|uniref:serpin family protein n=1 Tax=Leadbetterella sp. DM7 TaxID=3235085 RepID=UPI00349E4DEA